MGIKKTTFTSDDYIKNHLYPWDYKDDDEMFIGYSTINLMKQMEMKTIRYIDNPNDNKDKLYELGWFPTFVKIWEWAKNNPFYNPKKYKLLLKPKRHKL